MPTVVIASNNKHKVSEIRQILDFDGWDFKTLAEMGLASDPDENAQTFEGNARIKAQAVRTLCPDCAVLADDSGLVVDALDGRPGVYSSRFAGEDATDAENNQLLLAELDGVAEQDRTARFVCTIVFYDEQGNEFVAEGSVEGIIGTEECGAGGFGYDPLFYPDVFGRTCSMAEVAPEDKNRVSHRGNALRALKKMMQ
ncbi:RdgB/HAM1 family non-canonical purine NTP pyrophosphatase [Eggerthellaceae bacterium 3-80]|nr:RdgB/HAM1 family non-canonical purine NTP pyrophosphatase [bacterium D16-34]